MTEKYDGYRAMWTGTHFVLKRSNRFGGSRILTPPAWFTAQLPPNVYLDGELWCGRNTRQHLHSLLQLSDISDLAWQQISFVIFDSPDPMVRMNPYLIRL